MSVVKSKRQDEVLPFDVELKAKTANKTANLKVLGTVLDLTVHKVNKYLYESITLNGWLDLALRADADIVDRIKSLPQWEKTQPKSKSEPEGLGTKLGLAAWFVRKVGGIVDAKKLLDAYCLAAERLEEN